MNTVLITITGIETGDTYYSRSYPDDDYNDDGKVELYSTPVYKVTIENTLKVPRKKNGRYFDLCLFGMTQIILRHTIKQEAG